MWSKTFQDIVGAAKNATEVVLAPAAIVASVVNATTKPIADAARETAEAVQEGVSPKDGDA